MSTTDCTDSQIGLPQSEVGYYLELSKVSLQWRMEEQEIAFSVKHIDVPKYCASALYRDSELAYIAACERTFVIPFFDLNVRGDPYSLKDAYIKAVRVLVAGRVHVTILTDRLAELKSKIKTLKDLLSRCDEKMHFNMLRTEMFEAEMSRLSSDNPFKASDRFSSFLANTAGFAAVTKILIKESRRLSAPPPPQGEEAASMEREPTWEEVNNIGIEESLEDLMYCWDFLQHWQIIHAVGVRCRYGEKGYPVTTSLGQAPAKSVKGGLRQSVRPGWGERSFDQSSPRQRNPPSPCSPPGRSALLMRSTSGINTLVPIVSGNGVGPWEAVCDALECRDISSADDLVDSDALAPLIESMLVLASRRVLDMVRSPFLVQVVSRVAVNGLAAAVKDMSGDLDHCSVTADAILVVLAEMGKYLETRLLSRLRTSPIWISTLSDLRKSRVKREGGKLVVRDDGEVEISAEGRLRTIPFADSYVDSDVLHGSLQRLKVEVVAPQCRVVLKENTDLFVELQGERSCSAQLMYSIALPLLQRTMRAAMVRHRYNGIRRVLITGAMDAAAAVIQAWLIGCHTRAWYRIARAARRLWACTILQKYSRGFLARRRAKGMIRFQLDNSRDAAAAKLQALVRGVLARRRFDERIIAGKAEMLKEAQDWGVVIIQKIARGYIARKTVIRSYHIRNSLSKPIMKLTEKYLRTGNLWSFLKELDMTMRRVTDQLKETEEREDTWADTFVHKVVDKRKKEFDGAWNSFHEALSIKDCSSSPLKLNGAGATPSPYGKDPVLSAAGIVKGPLLVPGKQMTQIGSISDGCTGEVSKSPGHISVPGVLLRRAITTTVAEGIKQKEETLKASISTLAKQKNDIQGAYGSTLTAKSVVEVGAARKKRVGLTIQPNRAAEKKHGKIGACSSDWLTDAAGGVNSRETADTLLAARGGKEKGTPYSRQQQLESLIEGSMSPRQQFLVPVKLSDFLLLDIPLGMADKVDRLLYAAALRCFVPDFFPHHSLQEAYALYRQLPNGLTKVRYEQCAYAWSQPLVTKLRMKGLCAISDLMPMSKCDMFLRSVGAPLHLLDTAKDIIAVLMNQDHFSLGLSHADTKQRVDALLSKESVSVLEHSSRNTGVGSKKIAQSDVSPKPVDVNFRFAEAFLKHSVASGRWSDMSAPVDELLLHAAFFVCPNVDVVNNTAVLFTESDRASLKHSRQYDLAAAALGDGYKGFKRIQPRELDPKKTCVAIDDLKAHENDHLDTFGNEKIVTLHGHDSFLLFAQYLEFIAVDADDTQEAEDRQREAIRERYRTALLLSTPYELNLKSNGVNTVAHLARYNLSVLDLLPLYRAQIESMISTAIAASVGVKEADNVNTGKHLPPVNNQIAFKVPLLYNNKFQRGPFDPYGIPPRMKFSTSMAAVSIIEKKIEKTKMTRKRENKPSKNHLSRNDIDAPVELPAGLWELSASHDPPAELAGVSSDVKHGEYSKSGSVNMHNYMSNSDLSKGRSLSNFYKTLPGPREARTRREKKEFSGTFERPYKCSHRGCHEAFSRPYTLRMHEKSHLIEYRDYLKYRNNPQYGLDADEETQKNEEKLRFENAVKLPRYIEDQLNHLQQR